MQVTDTDTWTAVLRVAFVLVSVRLVMLARDVACGNLPWTRMLLPSIVWIETAGTMMWQARLGTGLVLEIAFLVVAIRALRRRGEGLPEVRIARSLEALLPPRIARLAALEMVIVVHAVRFLFGGWRRPAPAGFTYHRESGLRTLLPILPLLGAGDVLLLELVVLPHAATWLRIVLHVLAAYGLLWLVGVYASMRARPHRLAGDRLELHRGVLRHHVVSRADVASIEPLPSFSDDWKKRAYLKKTLRLDIAGGSVLEMRLRDGSRVIVAVDDPAAFVAALSADKVAESPPA